MERQINRKQISKWWRVALLVAGRLKHEQQNQNLNRDTKLILESAASLEGKMRSLDIAFDRNWRAAERLAISDCQNSVNQTERLLSKLQQSLSQLKKRPKPILKEIFLDLAAIDEEFDELQFDAKTKLLSVVSKSIHLEDIRLGRFRIELSLDSLSAEASGNYEVIEVDPNPAAPNENVTHPHVERNRLCEGDAQPAIRLALQQARLFDFFQIVQQVLSTYNPSSAYVQLSEWEGVNCRQCGYTSSSDDSRDCSNCVSTICDECIGECDTCNEFFCSDCYTTCDDCCEVTCNTCLEACKDCDQRFCNECITENERCKSCEKKSKEEEKDEDSSPSGTEPAVHADSMGEAVVPA